MIEKTDALAEIILDAYMDKNTREQIQKYSGTFKKIMKEKYGLGGW